MKNNIGMENEVLVKIGSKKDSSVNITRRDFLKFAGSAAAVGAVGCAKDHEQKLYPRVRSDEGQIPGVPVWYSSTCTECSAGCGIKVKTYDGRSIKVEGNKSNPINRGGLCALGQASLQNLYDPDRIRQPLQRSYDDKNQPQFKPITWDEAYSRISDNLKSKEKQNIFLTGEVTGALEELLTEFNTSFGAIHSVFDILSPDSLSEAAGLVYGEEGVPRFAFDKAEVILNFGADFLETWVSPVEYASGWAAGKRKEKPLKFFQVEPRLSLTGANADSWVKCKPGTELIVAAAILSELLNAGGNKIKVSGNIKEALAALTKEHSAESASAASGISREKILTIVHELKNAPRSLVLSGGANSSLELNILTSLINVVLGNVGQTVFPKSTRKFKSSLKKLLTAIGLLNKQSVNVLFTYAINPVFTAPSTVGFKYAARKAELVVCFASHLDETARLADIILPYHSSLETWGDSRVVPGVYSLVQPSMTPIYDTKAFGDIVIEIAGAAGVSFPKAGDKKSFYEYLKSSWKAVHNVSGSNKNFEAFWRESLEEGGYFAPVNNGEADSNVKISNEVYELKIATPVFNSHGLEGHNQLILYPFISVKSFDGRAANRPWLQELPDPITAIVWDSWAELHPNTANKLGVKHADLVTIRNHEGEVNVPVYVTEYVHEDIVAVPVGQGHKDYGRFAQKVGGGNVLELITIEKETAGDSLYLVSSKVSVTRAAGKHALVITSGSNSQLDRGLARTKFIDASATENKNDHAAATHGETHSEHASDHSSSASHGKGGGHHPEVVGYSQHDYHGADNSQKGGPKQMYKQREHPLYEWGMSVDLAACTGCSACVVACYAENNISVVGKEMCDQGREMSWLRIERYYDSKPGEELVVSFLPMMCQHCHNAPCEPVCPVYATYHNEEGMNMMVYNRCVGTRYCSNNCSYKVRRFNWLEMDFPEPLNWQLNPDVTKRGTGVMEKCTFCVQRIVDAKDHAKDLGRLVQDGEVQPACVQSCPTQALVFGDLNDPESKVSKLHHDERAYKILSAHINTQPAISYLEDIKTKV